MDIKNYILAIGALAAISSGAATLHVGATSEYKTIQSAIDAVPSGGKEWTTIEIEDGVYREFAVVPKDKPFVRLVAKNEGKVTMTSNESVYTIKDKNLPECTALKTMADDFEAVGIVFENTASKENVAAGGRGVGQALAVKTEGDRQVFRRCRFLGHQDTLMTNAPWNRLNRNYFEDCYLEGTVDFIYGGSRCLFYNCDIYSVLGGYVTAASTPENSPFGYVFKNCRLKTAEGQKTFLGRPWRPFAKTVFVNCEMDAGIRPEGWNNWRKPEAEKTTYYAEFNCTGPGAAASNMEKRVKWGHYDAEEWSAHLKANGCADEFDILKGEDSWKPVAGD